jgi:hypothetical protein
VPLTAVGSPVIPVTDAARAAVRDVFATTIAGEGVLGGGLVFNTPVDRAPNGGATPAWSVCTSTPEETATADPDGHRDADGDAHPDGRADRDADGDDDRDGPTHGVGHAHGLAHADQEGGKPSPTTTASCTPRSNGKGCA